MATNFRFGALLVAGLLGICIWATGLLAMGADAIAADAASPRVLTDRAHHLRIAGPREWSDFPEQPEAARLDLKFADQANATEQTLVVRQQDVKQAWRVRLNGKELGRLVIDENDMRLYFPVPPQTLREGENVLTIEALGTKPKVDDIRVGPVRLIPLPRERALAEANVRVHVRDADSGEPLPARITVLGDDGVLQSVGAVSNPQQAVRPGTIFTAGGEASFGLPAGHYTLHAGRGFEYSLATCELDIVAGQDAEQTLKIRRQVPTTGYVACDTHVHTLTFSGHGDATLTERLITLAAEGIELPIATDHNRHVNYDAAARELGVRQRFTPVVGNEVTTAVGHFNIFPVREDAPPPDYKATDWDALFAGIFRTPDVKVVILNHARDLHSGTRPFGPALHVAAAGASTDGRRLQANAMEVINSGATQTDTLQLLHDWMTMLNHGRLLTPVGGSDSHDVARHFVGQGRTYIRARDDDPSAIDVDEAVNNFLQGRVMVSYGLLAELTVDERYHAGELVPLPAETVGVRVRVLGPDWVSATKVLLFANGELIREQDLTSATATKKPATEQASAEAGVLADVRWHLPRPEYDQHLVAIAVGPGIAGSFWKTAKAYQPTSPDWTPHVVGCSGAVWLDGDRNGRKTPASDYARLLVTESGGDLARLLALLKPYDEATAIQAAHLWQTSGRSLLAGDAQPQLAAAAPHVARGISRYVQSWRESQQAMLE
jgi:hypothetical protein